MAETLEGASDRIDPPARATTARRPKPFPHGTFRKFSEKIGWRVGLSVCTRNAIAGSAIANEMTKIHRPSSQ